MPVNPNVVAQGIHAARHAAGGEDPVTPAAIGADVAGAAAAAQAESLQKTANLSDLANATTALGNLGLAGSATSRAVMSYDTAAHWASLNPILNAREQAFETDTGVIKLGDGVTRYAALNPILSFTYLPLAGLVGIDTDGVPYLASFGVGTDTDGVPYYDVPTVIGHLKLDTDGVPYVPEAY